MTNHRSPDIASETPPCVRCGRGQPDFGCNAYDTWWVICEECGLEKNGLASKSAAIEWWSVRARCSAATGEPVAWQFRQRSGVGKGPQSQHPWGDWCSIDREDYDLYARHPNPLVQVRPLYADDAQVSGLWVCTGCGSQKSIEQIRGEHPGAIACCPERKMAPAQSSPQSEAGK